MTLRTSVYSASFVLLTLAIILVIAYRDPSPASATTPPTQTITICKTTVPPGGIGFPFTWTAGSSGLQPPFLLNDTQCSVLDVTLLDKFNTITEVVPPGWTLTNIVCVAATSPVTITGANSNAAFQPGDNTVIIDLNEPNVTCTFTNTQNPTHPPTDTASPTATATATATATPCPPAVCPDTGTPTATPCPIGAVCPTATPCGAGAICTSTPTVTPCVPAPCQTTPTPTATATPTATVTSDLVTPTPTQPVLTTPRPTIGPILWGDHNCSLSADPVDSLLNLRYDAGLTVDTGDCPVMGDVVDVENASPHIWGDLDCSGEANPVDSLKLLRYDAGLEVDQPEHCPDPGQAVVITL